MLNFLDEYTLSVMSDHFVDTTTAVLGNTTAKTSNCINIEHLK